MTEPIHAKSSLEDLLRSPPVLRDKGFSLQVANNVWQKERLRESMLSGVYFLGVLTVSSLFPWKELRSSFHEFQQWLLILREQLSLSDMDTITSALGPLTQSQELVGSAAIILFVMALLHFVVRE